MHDESFLISEEIENDQNVKYDEYSLRQKKAYRDANVEKIS